MNRRATVKWAPAALVALVAVSLAGCSSSKSPSTSVGSAANSPTGAPIKFGVIGTDVGPTGQTQDAPATVKRWQDYINSHGGINGHPVQVTEMSDGGSPATALQDFETLKASGVVAIGDASILDSAFEKAADAANIPVVAMSADEGSPTFSTDPNFFPLASSPLNGAWGYVKAAALSGHNQLGVLYCSESPACATLPKLTQAYGSQLGVSIPYNAAFSASSPNYTAQCLAAKGQGVNSLIVAGTDPAANLRVIDDCAQQGYYPVPLLGGGAISTVVTSDKNIHEAGIVLSTMPWWVHNAATATFHTVMDSYLPSAASDANVMVDWVGLQGMAEAAQAGVLKSATPTTQDIYNGLYTFKGNTVGGLSVAVTYTQGKVGSACGIWVAEMNNGAFSTPYGITPYLPSFCATPSQS